MDIAQLRTFLAVAEELHFGRAAHRLHLTVAPVSRAVRNLERELGVALFVRRYHEVRLTPAGRVLAEGATRVLADVGQLAAEVRSAAAPQRRVVRVGGTHRAPPRVLDDVVACIESGCPELEVDATVGTSGELVPRVRRGEVDLAVVYLPVEEPGLGSLPVARYPLSLAMRRDDPLAGASRLAADDVADRQVIMGAPDAPTSGAHVPDALRALGLRDLRVMDDPSTDRIANLVRRQRVLAVTIDPSLGGPSRIYDDPAWAVVPLTGAPYLELGLVWRAESADEPVVAAALAAIRVTWADRTLDLAPAVDPTGAAPP